VPTTIGGYLTKGGTCDGGHYELRVLTSPRVSLPRYESSIVGYYTDEHGVAETMNPCLALLPHGRFLAGWTMGEGMSTAFKTDVYDDEREAWLAAHHVAERDAEDEREWQASRCAECYDNERRGHGELPELCETCYLDSPDRTLATHATE
jgi:hypothetical protein